MKFSTILILASLVNLVACSFAARAHIEYAPEAPKAERLSNLENQRGSGSICQMGCPATL
jgi:hypothetical protein